MKNIKPAKSDGRGAQNDLIRVMERYRLTLPRNAAEWRVAYGPNGSNIFGDMPGITNGKVRLLCTDGLMAWFLLGDGETVLWGHLANLVVEKEEKSGGERRVGTKPRKKDNVSLAMELLFADEKKPSVDAE